MRVLVVGQAPSRVMAAGDPPLWRTGALTRLAGYAGVEPRERLYELFGFTNLIEEWPGPAEDPKYDDFPVELARANLDRVVETVRVGRYSHVVTLGAAVRSVWPGSRTEWLVWRHATLAEGMEEVRVAHSPHPGGTSMWWNDKANEESGRRFWLALAVQVDHWRRWVPGHGALCGAALRGS